MKTVVVEIHEKSPYVIYVEGFGHFVKSEMLDEMRVECNTLRDQLNAKNAVNHQCNDVVCT